MTEIDQGTDCTRRLKKPRNRLRLERRRIYAKPEALYRLRLLEVPLECSFSCYTWRHISGGGTLAEEVGKAVYFRAPLDIEECSGSAVINVYCAGQFLDTAYITVNLYEGEERAYSIVTGEIRADEHTGSTYTKPDGTKALALEYLSAYYYRRYYDCAGNYLMYDWGAGMRRWGLEAPVAQLEAKYGEQVGRVRDYRTKEMKEKSCCPIPLLEAEML